MAEPAETVATSLARLRPWAVHARRGGLIAILVVAAALALVARQEPMYRSTATVVVGLRTFENGAPAQNPNMANEREIAMSAVVAGLAADALGVPPTTAGEGLSVSVPIESSVLKIAAMSPEPREAQRRANAFAESYVAYRTVLTEAEAEAQAATGAARVSQPATVISRARLAPAPASPNWPLSIAASVMVALAMGALTTVALGALDDRVRSGADLEQRLGLPVLATVSAAPAVDAEFEGYRRLRDQLLGVAEEVDARTLLVTTAGPSEGAAAVAGQLAAALARAQHRTVLLSPGPVPSALTRLPEPNLSVTTFDADGCLDGDVLAAALTDTVAGHLRTDLDFVVMWAEAVAESSMAFALASMADLTLVVAMPGRSRATLLSGALAELERTTTRLAGVVLMVEPRRPPWRRRLQPPRTRRAAAQRRAAVQAVAS